MKLFSVFFSQIQEGEKDLEWATTNFLPQYVKCSQCLLARYRVAMLYTGFTVPILFTWLGYVPLLSGLLRKLKPHLPWPSTIGTSVVRPLPFLLGNAPTVGQSLYIVMFIILNIILTAISYRCIYLAHGIKTNITRFLPTSCIVPDNLDTF
jgi:hypothetical protein